MSGDTEPLTSVIFLFATVIVTCTGPHRMLTVGPLNCPELGTDVGVAVGLGVAVGFGFGVAVALAFTVAFLCLGLGVAFFLGLVAALCTGVGVFFTAASAV